MKQFITRGVALRGRACFGMAALVASCACGTAVAADTNSQAVAQAQSSSTAGVGAGFENSALAEIIVTARKREERLQDVPVSMTTFTAKDIQRYQTQTLTDIANLTPQLVIGSSTNPTGTIYLRGIGASNESPTIDQAVSINVDGVQISQAQIIRLAQLDLKQIEVLKGPQSLFYGKDSPAGVISLTSADPGANLEAKIRTGYEIYNQQEFIEGMVSGPLNDVLGARLDVYATTQKGWIIDDVPAEAGVTIPQTTTYPDQKEFFGRFTLGFTPSEIFDGKLKLNAGRLDQKAGPAGGDELFSCPKGAPQTAFGTPDPDTCRLSRYISLGVISPAVAALEPHFGDGQTFLTSAQELGSFTANYRPVNELTITSVTGYYKDAEDSAENFCRSVLACLPAFSYTDISQWTEELRARTSLPGPVNFVLGGLYQHLQLNVSEGVIFGAPIVPAPALYENFFGTQLTNSHSEFAQVVYDFSPLWELTAGARYTSESKSETVIRYPSVLNGFGAAAPIPLADPDVHFTNTSPEATLTFKPSHDLTLYGAYRSSFVAGGFNFVSFLTPHSDNSYKPETAKGGELGVKGILFDQQLRFDTDIYHYKYSELQLSTFDPVTLSLPVVNAGAATIEGIESSFVYVPKPFPQISLRGTVAYNHNKYDSFVSTCYSGQTIAQGCDLNFAGGNYNSTNLAGAPLSHSPSWAAAVGASYETPINDRMSLASSMDGNYSGPFYTAVAEDPRSLQRQFWKLDLAIALHAPDHAWEVALIGKNVTNRLTITESEETNLTGAGFGKPGPILPSDMDGILSPPRTVMIQFTLTNALFHK